MKHAKQTRAPWILLACLAAIALCIVAAVTLLQPNTNPKNIEIPGTRGNIPATIQLPAKSARGEELPLVVLCHGFTGNRQGDGHFAPLAEDLAAHGIATVRLDFAGCGDSTEPYANYTLANMAADVDSVIGYMQATYGTGKTALVGHSMGGRLASLYPQLGQYPVTELALWSPANGTGLQGLEFLSIDNFAAVEELAARADAEGSVAECRLHRRYAGQRPQRGPAGKRPAGAADLQRQRAHLERHYPNRNQGGRRKPAGRPGGAGPLRER